MVHIYHNFGIQLGVPEHKIKEFEKEHSETYRRFSAVILYWLNNSEAVSWDCLIAALESPSVNQKKLASELRKKHSVSSLSTETQGILLMRIKLLSYWVVNLWLYTHYAPIIGKCSDGGACN